VAWLVFHAVVHDVFVEVLMFVELTVEPDVFQEVAVDLSVFQVVAVAALVTTLVLH
jgi:hypothetical protein